MDSSDSQPRSPSRTVLSVVATALMATVAFVLLANSGSSSHQATTPGAAPLAATQMDASSSLYVDMSKMVGSSTSGVWALSSTTADTSDWAPWGLSLSGNGFMAEAAGVGVLRALSETGILDQLSTIASVSGGTWFNSQFSYSKDYYDAVVGNTNSGTAGMKSWYEGWEVTALNGMMGAFGAGKFIYEQDISAMLAAYDSPVPDLAASQANRFGNSKADLVLCCTLVGDSLLSDNTSQVLLQSNGKNMPDSVPAYWAVPTSGAASWNVPLANPDDHSDLSSLSWVKKGTSDSSSDVSTILADPNVAKIAAMSSAANGITANVGLSASMQPQDQYYATFGSYLNPDNGVCTTKGDTCSGFASQTMDGCYSDNLGFAANLGYLQKKFPGKNLRIMAVSSELCDRDTDPTCLTAVTESAFRSLFSDSPYPTVEGWLPAIVSGPNRIVFKESVTDMQALGQQTGYGGETFFTGTFTTVKNDNFGVAAGTKVSVLVLNVNGPLNGASLPATATGKAQLAEVAVNSYESMMRILSTYDANGQVSSGSAFLYYQSS